VGKDASGVAPAGTPVRIRVQTPNKVPMVGVTVEIVSLRQKLTNNDGLVEFLLDDAEVDKVSASADIHTRRIHCGPDPGAGKKVVPGGAFLKATLVKNKGFDPATPGLETDAKGQVLVQVLVDAGVDLANEHADIKVRDLTPRQASEALLFHSLQGDMVLTLSGQEFEFVFKHFEEKDAKGDVTNFFKPCDGRCTFVKPDPQALLGIKDQTAKGVRYFYVNHTPFVNGKPGMDFAIGSAFTKLDPRNAIGVCRLAQRLKAVDGAIEAVYHIGINGDDVRNDCHGFGRAIDFAGVAKAVPVGDPKQKDPQGVFFRSELRADTDFFVFWHWGQVLPWDPATTTTDDTTKFKRFNNVQLPKTDFPRLRYRLLSPLPTGASDFAARVFQAVHTFAVDQYQDRFQSKQEESNAKKDLAKLQKDAQDARDKANKIKTEKTDEAQKKADAAQAKVTQAQADGKPQAEIDKLQADADKVKKDAFAQADRESKPSLDDADKKEAAAKAKEKALAPLLRPSDIGELPSSVLHPDYPKTNDTGCHNKAGAEVDCKNGREAHVNHLHFQVGQTFTKTPFE
jgi:hypothetical protein